MDANESLSPDDVKTRLDAAQAAERSTRYPALRWWLVGANVVLLPLLVLSQLAASRQGMTGLAIVIIVLNLIVTSSSGVVQGSYSSTFWGTLSVAAALVLVIGGSFAAYAITDASWVVVVAAVITGAIVLVAGLLYPRTSR